MAKFQLYTDTKFLVVDDQEEILKDLVAKLIEVGFDENSISKAKNGVEAIKIAKQNNDIEFFITDMVMPEKNGLEFIQELRQIPHYKFTPVMVLSSETDFTIIKPSITAGANNYVVKPMTTEILAQKLITSVDNANKKAG